MPAPDLAREIAVLKFHIDSAAKAKPDELRVIRDREAMKIKLAELERRQALEMALPYTHHGTTVHGSKLEDFLISELMLSEIEDAR